MRPFYTPTSTVLPLHLGATLFIYTHHHPLSVVSDGEEFGPPPPQLETLILKGREGLSSPLGDKSQLECLEQSVLFLAGNVSFRFALEEMIKKTLSMSFKMVFFRGMLKYEPRPGWSLL